MLATLLCVLALAAPHQARSSRHEKLVKRVPGYQSSFPPPPFSYGFPESVSYAPCATTNLYLQVATYYVANCYSAVDCYQPVENLYAWAVAYANCLRSLPASANNPTGIAAQSPSAVLRSGAVRSNPVLPRAQPMIGH